MPDCLSANSAYAPFPLPQAAAVDKAAGWPAGRFSLYVVLRSGLEPLRGTERSAGNEDHPHRDDYLLGV